MPRQRPAWQTALVRRYADIELDLVSVAGVYELADNLESNDSLDGLHPPAICLRARCNAAKPKLPPRSLSDRRPRDGLELEAGAALLGAIWRHVGDPGLGTLRVLKLHTIALARPDGWNPLIHALSTTSRPPSARVLRTLHLPDCNLGNAGVRLVSALVSSAPHLESLNLSGCGLPASAAEPLACLIVAHGRRRSDHLYGCLTREWEDALHPVDAGVGFQVRDLSSTPPPPPRHGLA